MDDNGIEDHPDLMDPDWRRHAEKEARVALRKTRRRSRPARRRAIPLAVLVIVAGAGYGVYRWGKDTSDHYTPGAPPPAAPATTAPTDLPQWGRVDLAHPFNDTPAQAWAEGITGLASPPPGRVGSFGAQQAVAAVEQVKQVISTAALDPATLVDHHTDKYLSLFAPDARPDLRQDVASPDATRAQAYVVFLDSNSHLLPVAPRMNGTITLRPGDSGELDVHVAYVAAYAFDPGGALISGPSEIVLFQRADEDYVVRAAPPFPKSSAGVWLAQTSGYTYSMSCEALKKGYLAPAYTDRYYAAGSVSVAPGIFDPNQPAPTEENCQ